MRHLKSWHLIAVFGWAAAATAQPFAQWTGQLVSTDGNCDIRALRTDAEGNIVVGGQFQGTVDIDPGLGVHLITSIGDQEPWLAKIDPAGDLIWGFGITHAVNDFGRGRALDLDAEGNVYFTGSYENDADFDPGPGTYTVPMFNTGYGNVFLAKYTPDGEVDWAFGFGGATGDEGNDVRVSPDGLVAIVADVAGGGDMDPGPEVHVVTGEGGGDGVLGLYTTDGAYAWAIHIGGDLDDGVSAVAFDHNGDVVVSGGIRATVNIDPTGFVYLNGTIDDHRQYLIKYSAQGELIWGEQFHSPGDGHYSTAGDGRAMQVAPDGRIYIVGGINGTVDMDPGPNTANLVGSGGLDGYMARYDSTGALEWAKRTGNNLHSYIVSMTLDDDRILVTGLFDGNTDFDPDAGSAVLNSIGDQSGFLASYDTTGAYQWAIRLSGDYYYNYCQGVDLTADGLVVGGNFFGDMDADPGSGIDLFQAGTTKDSYILGLGDLSTFVSEHRIQGELLWPVPATNHVNIPADLLRGARMLTVRDASGRAVAQMPAASVLNVAHLAPGVYALHSGTGTATLLGRFLKE